jgi:hypothetical protein
MQNSALSFMPKLFTKVTARVEARPAWFLVGNIKTKTKKIILLGRSEENTQEKFHRQHGTLSIFKPVGSD